MRHRLHGGAACVLFLACLLPSGVSIAQSRAKDAAVQAGAKMDPALAKDWMRRWKENILSDSAKNRYCDHEMGEEIGWLVSPFLNGYYYGYMATGDREWVDRLINWGDAVIKRGVKEPDGYVGWPKGGARAIEDSELGEAMFLRPLARMAGEILKTPALRKEYGAKAEEYLRLSEQTFEKWDSRDAWRETKEGGLWVVPPFGIDKATGQWTEGYARRKTDGFSQPDNKENLIAGWLLAMYDVTKKPVYRERAEKWLRMMKSRMKLRDDGKYFVWNYWEPAGPWDYKADGST